MIADLQLPTKLKPLFEPKRYKVVYGGRGSGKSHSIARALLILGAQKPLRILCAREFQNSIQDSVHKLLSDIIQEHELDGFYNVQQRVITGQNGTEFIFEGLRHNIQSIKSKEGIDIVWVEEAQTVSKASWDILVPTIRAEGSEIWITFNPELETDETYQRFVVNPPAETILIEMNYMDNPWFPDVLELERVDLKEKDPDAYMNVWEGKCKQALDGAIYQNELRAAEADGRITEVPYNATSLVHTYWDLGYSDTNSIWFIQKVGAEYRVIDYYENNFQSIQHYVKVLQDKPYVYGYDFLPHDGNSKQLGTGMTIREQMMKLGRKVQIVKKIQLKDGIAALRTVFPMLYFDRKKCADGLNSLRRYRYNVNAQDQTMSRLPLHDDASHAADALRYFAVSIRRAVQQRKEPKRPSYKSRGVARTSGY
jgi:phage terminase large subunit